MTSRHELTWSLRWLRGPLTGRVVSLGRRGLSLVAPKPRRWSVTSDGQALLAQEYAGFVVLSSEGTSLMSRLQSRFDLYEPDLVRALRREITCTQTPTFLDVGANIGLISLAVLAACPGVRVEAFDPGPHQSRLLQATIAYNRLEPRVRVHTIALGDADGEVDFAVHTSEHASGDGLIDTGRAGSVTTVRVPMQRLDSWWCAAGQPDARVVKVDTEGAELMILKGAQQFLAACRPTLFLEIWPDNLRNYPYSADDVLAGLNQLGYRLETLYGERVEPRHAATFWGREETYVARPR